MAQSIGDISQFTTANGTIHPQNASGNVTGTGVPTSAIGGGILTLYFDVGAVSSFTSAVCYAECSADNSSWVAAVGVGGTTPNVTITAANTTGTVAFFPANGTLSQYVRGNVVLTGTTANISASIWGQNRIDTSAGFQNTPPSGST